MSSPCRFTFRPVWVAVQVLSAYLLLGFDYAATPRTIAATVERVSDGEAKTVKAG